MTFPVTATLEDQFRDQFRQALNTFAGILRGYEATLRSAGQTAAADSFARQALDLELTEVDPLEYWKQIYFAHTTQQEIERNA